ncbi:MAG: signal peptidase I [Chloroflexota bacterium]|nr:signal peptidase I [Chloroflexota bacterium]
MEEFEDVTPEPGVERRGMASSVRRFLLRALWEVASTVLPAVFIALFVNVYVAQATVIDGPSMQPNLHYDQQVMVEKITYRFFHGPRRGDVVTFEIPGEKGALIKRVVALPGETVEVRGGEVFINGQLLEETWTTWLGGPDYPPTIVPPLHIFVLGDNRPNSRDSRYFGLVPVDHVTGRALFVCWPPDQAKSLR